MKQGQRGQTLEPGEAGKKCCFELRAGIIEGRVHRHVSLDKILK